MDLLSLPKPSPGHEPPPPSRRTHNLIIVGSDTFISQQLSAAQKGSLGVALAQAAAAIVEGGVDNDSAMHDLTLCIENLLYEAHLCSGAGCDVLTATPIRTRTTSDPHAIKELAPRTIENRRNAFVKTYQQLIGDKKAIPQQPYNWIKDVDQCVAAIAAAWKIGRAHV